MCTLRCSCLCCRARACLVQRPEHSCNLCSDLQRAGPHIPRALPAGAGHVHSLLPGQSPGLLLFCDLPHNTTSHLPFWGKKHTPAGAGRMHSLLLCQTRGPSPLYGLSQGKAAQVPVPCSLLARKHTPRSRRNDCLLYGQASSLFTWNGDGGRRNCSREQLLQREPILKIFRKDTKVIFLSTLAFLQLKVFQLKSPSQHSPMPPCGHPMRDPWLVNAGPLPALPHPQALCQLLHAVQR